MACAGPARWFNVSEDGGTCKGKRSGNLAGVGTAAWVRRTTPRVGALTCSCSTCDAVGDKKEVAN